MGNLSEDFKANRGHPKEQLLLASLRFAQAVRGTPVIGTAVSLMHRVISEIVFCIEIRPETEIGPGLRIFHGYGTVINTGSKLGKNVKIHQGVTIGARYTGGGSPTILDNSDIGAGAIILGDICIGPGSIVGAGAVVLNDVPAGFNAVGNPARLISKSSSADSEES